MGLEEPLASLSSSARKISSSDEWFQQATRKPAVPLLPPSCAAEQTPASSLAPCSSPSCPP